MISCKHWIDCGAKGGGCCAIEVFKGTGSYGICLKCDQYTENEQQRIKDKYNIEHRSVTKMKISCDHWRDCRGRSGGCCDLGLFGGKPSYGVCIHSCDKYTGTKEQKAANLAELQDRRPKRHSAGRRLMHGAKGLAESYLGLDKTPKEEEDKRRKICESNECGEYVPCFKGAKTYCCGPMLRVLGGGPTCGCKIERKIKVAGEKCPLKLWDSVPSVQDLSKKTSDQSPPAKPPPEETPPHDLQSAQA